MNPCEASLTLDELRALGTVTDIDTAARALGLSRSTAYELAKAGTFPCPVIAVPTYRGESKRKRYRVPVAGLLATLGVHTPTGA